MPNSARKRQRRLAEKYRERREGPSPEAIERMGRVKRLLMVLGPTPARVLRIHCDPPMSREDLDSALRRLVGSGQVRFEGHPRQYRVITGEERADG